MRSICFKTMTLAWIVASLAASVATSSAQTTPLITSATKWRYNHQNLELGTAWRAVGYDDTNTAGWMPPSSILFGFETTPAVYSAPGAGIEPQTFKTMFPDPVTETPYVTNY